VKSFERSARSCAALLAALTCSAQTTWLDTITAADLRATDSFLASRSLEGRNTPSPGLEAAADYIVSEFRRDNLESPPGATDFAQAGKFARVSDSNDSQFTLSAGRDLTRAILGDHMAIHSFHAANLNNEPVFKWAPTVRVDQTLGGQILVLRAPFDRTVIRELEQAHPDAIVELTRRQLHHRNNEPVDMERLNVSEPIRVAVPEGDLQAIFDRLPNGTTTAHATLHIGAPSIEPFEARNLIAMLRGSDPALEKQYVIVSAHYDHLGVSKEGIFYGANDNASGVAAVLALAHAFSLATPHPKRTLLFLCFFGEEEGLLGSTWYVKHPLLPLSHTVANINFEQLGRSEPSDGLPPGSLGATGYAFCDLPAIMSTAMDPANVHLRDTKHNEDFFARSDNFPFAKAGIPAQTFAAAYEFPDYHRPTDTWDKLDFNNEALLVRALALGITAVADRAEPPHWNESAKTKDFVAARRELHD
jgi:hypothetical protein